MYLIFDEETQIHQSHKRKANPFNELNYVVMRGWKKQGDKQASWARFEKDDPGNHLHIDADVTVLVGHNIKFDLLYEMVGKNPQLRAFFQRGGRIWDTQYAEYLLKSMARKYHMNSMNDIAPKYGGRVKIDQLSAMWKAGIQTADIDPDLLADYLVGTKEEKRDSGDIGNTEKMYLGQLKLAKSSGMLRSMYPRMDGLAATTEMEFNGIKIDRVRAAKNQKILEVKLAEVTARLSTHVEHIPTEVGFNWGSGTHKSCLIFGGTIRYAKSATYTDVATGELARLKATADWPLFNGKPINPQHPKLTQTESGHYEATGYKVVVLGQDTHGNDITEKMPVKRMQDTFKSGKRKGDAKCKKMPVQGELKTKIQDFFFDLPRITEPRKEWKGALLDGAGLPVYGTSSEVIEKLAKRDIPFLKDMGENAALVKELGTYYERYDEKKKTMVGMLTCVMDDDVVHHMLNHTSTVTSRLSSSNPNGQNFPRGDKSDLKAIFVSRFGDKGRMIEADYSQLEVVVQGLLSNDKRLCADLINKIDFHCKRVSLKNSVSYDFALMHCKDEEKSEDFKKWKTERTKCKIFSFQRAYGAGAGLIAEETGMDIEEVKSMIIKEDAEYPGIVNFNKAVAASVDATAEPYRDKARGFRVFRKGYWQSPTGTLYQWTSGDAPSYLKKQGITDTFKPTELKNYPVQGTGGELVQLAVGRLWRYFMKKNNWDGKALLVNTVHDCVWVDCHEDVVEEVARAVKHIMESIPLLLKKFYGMDCPVPFPVDVEAGINMLELHHAA